jgi:putative hydrolase of the HAD superfamily
MGFEKIFNKTYFSYEIGHKKPDKKFFEFIFNDLNKREEIEPQEIMFWDDKKSNVISAKEIGWQSFLYTNFDEFYKIVSQIK